ncbi:hypothetical protein [Streptomyces lavendulocolor]|uniref:hypothetical protein n=1 Tax=Streptomyces lavendulocolor TaxID=67316 RepID=UPI003C2D464B
MAEAAENPGTWAQLLAEQQQRLSKLGVHPSRPGPGSYPSGRAGEGPTKAQQAFQRGLAALAQWIGVSPQDAESVQDMDAGGGG